MPLRSAVQAERANSFSDRRVRHCAKVTCRAIHRRYRKACGDETFDCLASLLRRHAVETRVGKAAMAKDLVFMRVNPVLTLPKMERVVAEAAPVFTNPVVLPASATRSTVRVVDMRTPA